MKTSIQTIIVLLMISFCTNTIQAQVRRATVAKKPSVANRVTRVSVPADRVVDHRTPSTSTSGSNSTPDHINLPDNLRPAFANVPVWRLQLRVKTSNREKANTDSKVYVQFRNSSSSIFYLNKGGDDREKNKTDVYDILDPNIKTIRDIQFLKLVIKGKDGWCIERLELLVNGAKVPVFKKTFRNCYWIDKDSGAGPSLVISGAELRRSSTWRHTSNNKVIWLPPSILRRHVLEQMVESYVGHLMNSDPQMKDKDMNFGYKDGRAYVEATRVAKNKLHFNLDLKSHFIKDLKTDVNFNLVVKCQNNRLQLQAENVKGRVDIPILSRLLDVFRIGVHKMCIGNINFANANVPICPRINVTAAGDVKFGL